HGALRRAREGKWDDGAGADGADRHVLVRRRQGGSVFLHLAGVGCAHHPRRHGAFRPADARELAVTAVRHVAVHRRRARDGAPHLDRRRDAAGGVPGGGPVVVPADAAAVGFHLSDLEHAARAAARDDDRARAVLSRGAARHRAEGHVDRAALAADDRADDLRGRHARARVGAAGAGASLMQRLMCLVRKEFLELRQNPRLFGIVIVAPIIQLTMLGYAASTDVKDVPVVVADGDRSPASRTLIARFDASPNFTIVDTVTSVGQIDRYLQRGSAWIALAIPTGYGAALQ